MEESNNNVSKADQQGEGAATTPTPNTSSTQIGKVNGSAFLRKSRKFFKSYWFLLTVLIFIWTYIISPLKPDLSITYSITPFQPPFDVNVPDSASDSENKPSSTPMNFLKSEDIITIDIENCTHSKIEDIELKLKGIRNIFGISGSSTSRRLRTEIQDILSYEHDNGLLFFPNLAELPSRSSVHITAYCSLSRLTGSSPIGVSASVPNISVKRKVELEGFQLFWGKSTPFLAGLLLLWAILIGLRNWKDE